MKITVTQKHLDEGNVDTTSCHPVSLAIAEAVGRPVLGLSAKRSGKGNCVGGEHPTTCSFVFFSWKEDCLPLPSAARELFRAISTQQLVALPFSFELVGLQAVVAV